MAGKTEWEDALIKQGIIPAPKEEKTYDDRFLETYGENERKASEARALKRALDADGDDEDALLERLRERRMAELSERAGREAFGYVAQISKADFVAEVTKASERLRVVCLLFMSGHEKSDLLRNAVAKFAQKHRTIKCVQIYAQDCIENYPEHDVPLVFVYSAGDLVGSCLKGLNGVPRKKYDVLEKIFEAEMRRLSVVDADEDDDREETRDLFDVTTMRM